MKYGPAAVLLLSLTFNGVALCASITTIDGVVYREAQVTSIEPDGLRITHKFGVAKVPFEELPETLRTKYHYDKKKADAYRQQLSARKRSSASGPAPTAQQQQAQAGGNTGMSPAAGNQQRQETPPRTGIQRIMAIIVSSGVLLFIFGLVLVLYFLPTLVGLRKQNAGKIFLLNLFLGWTLAGWIRAFIWACSDAKPSQSKSA